MRLSGRKHSTFIQSWTQRQRVSLLLIISLNIAVFAGQVLFDFYQPGFIHDYVGLCDRGVRDAYAWQFLTAMFLHSGPWHLLGNMLVLYFLGRDLEVILGQRHFVYLYLSGAIAGELGHLFLMPSETVLLAASGGVAAVIVAYATVLPELELTSLRFFFLPIRLKAIHLAYVTFFGGLILLCVARSGTVTHSAWLGGCAAGWLYVHLLGFGRTSLLQRFLRRRRAQAERYEQLSVEELITQEIDPLLEKISRLGFPSLSKKERRNLSRAREKILEKEKIFESPPPV